MCKTLNLKWTTGPCYSQTKIYNRISWKDFFFLQREIISQTHIIQNCRSEQPNTRCVYQSYLVRNDTAVSRAPTFCFLLANEIISSYLGQTCHLPGKKKKEFTHNHKQKVILRKFSFEFTSCHCKKREKQLQADQKTYRHHRTKKGRAVLHYRMRLSMNSTRHSKRSPEDRGRPNR